MKVLVVGSGGREHALVKKIKESPLVDSLYCAPGNAGIAEDCTCADIEAVDINGLARFAEQEAIDLTVVGPEVPLLLGIADVFNERGLKVFGPSKAAAEIEGSKIYAKKLMDRMGIPTARFREFSEFGEALDFLETAPYPVVLKADGLAAGKGVVVPETNEEAAAALEDMMCEGRFGQAGRRVVIEERLFGQEVSILAFTDGETVLPLEPARDHKKVFDNDRGLNTGGMGAYSPVPGFSKDLEEEVVERILRPAVAGLKADGRPYRGVLYAGLMITKDGPVVLEFNCRFGDPETQALLVRLQNDLVEVMEAAISGSLKEQTISFRDEAAVCVVLTSQGYPGPYTKGKVIHGLDAAPDDILVFHAGTAHNGGRVVTSGGRVLGITSLAGNLQAAALRVYEFIESGAVGFEGMHYRTDIGKKS